MKIRNGFVSNSSSSSFVIFGDSFDIGSDEIKALMEKHLTPEEILMVNDGEEMLCEYLYGKTKLEIHQDYECELIYIGRSWSDIKDDQTGKQFKDSVKDELDILLPGSKPRTIEAEICMSNIEVIYYLVKLTKIRMK